MEEEKEMDATERSRKEGNRHDGGPMVAAACRKRVLFYITRIRNYRTSGLSTGPLV